MKELTILMLIISLSLAGLQTSVQDWPGRVGLWHVGVPPSGPMDSLAFRLANALVGNAESAAGEPCERQQRRSVYSNRCLQQVLSADVFDRLQNARVGNIESVAGEPGQQGVRRHCLYIDLIQVA